MLALILKNNDLPETVHTSFLSSIIGAPSTCKILALNVDFRILMNEFHTPSHGML